MDLRQEIKQVAAQLGFQSRLSSEKAFEKQLNGTDIKKKKPQKSFEKKPRSKPKRKAGIKTDVYDKRALLEILSGPEETKASQLKNLKKARSILPKNVSPLWHVALQELPALSPNAAKNQKISDERLNSLKQQAKDLLQNEKDAFEYQMHRNKKQGTWLMQIREQGTHVDKIAAFSLLIRDSIIANIHEMDYLLNLVEKQKGSRDLVIRSMKALGELFLRYLLPDRKLLFFEDRSLAALDGSETAKLHVLYWFLEDGIKRRFERFITALESATMAPLEHLRSESVTLVYSLLYEKPEQEGRLLSILIHKLGDTSKKLGSKVAFLISKLISKHPRMKHIIFKEAEKFVFLKGTSLRAVQCVLQTFNSIQFEKTPIDQQTATAYVDLCFTLFQQMVDGHMGSNVDLQRKEENKALLKGAEKRRRFIQSSKRKTNDVHQKMEIDATVFNALISGIRRSLPFADGDQLGRLLEKHTNALFRMIHLATFGVSVQILALLFQILPSQLNALDRLYRAMYAKILDPRLTESRKLPLFISTLFKAMKDDPNLNRVVAFVKRLCQISVPAEPHLFCAFLLLISELIKFKPGLKEAIMQQGEKQTSKKKPSIEASKNGTNNGYDMDHREPLFCGAESTGLWELCSTLHHFHPVVQASGITLLENQSVASRGDPLQELTLFTFLDKFVNSKDAKMKSSSRNRVPLTPGTSFFEQYRGSATFSALAARDVPVEDVFFHKYFNLQNVKKARKARQTAKITKQSKEKGRIQNDVDEELLSAEGTDLESFEDLELDEAEISAKDVIEMFGKPDSKRKSSKELYDYSELLNDVQRAYQVDSDEVEIENEEVDSESDESGMEVDLPTQEFPEMSDSHSEEEFRDKKKSKRRKSNPKDDFAPAEDYSDLMDFD